MSQSINIPTKSFHYYSYSVPKININKYLFELVINLKHSTQIMRKIDENKFTTLLSTNNNIKYNDIIGYSINITIIPDHLDQVFHSTGKINQNMPFYSNQANNIHIEFIKSQNGCATCRCKYIDYNNLSFSCSPPF